MYGYSFCTAARQAFKILLANVLRLAAINTVGAFVLFVCKLVVVCLTGMIAIAMLKSDDSLHYYAIVVFVICVFAYMIADTFIGVYKMGVDTIFIAFCEDHKHNDGSQAKPFFASEKLLKFMSSSERRAQAATTAAE